MKLVMYKDRKDSDQYGAGTARSAWIEEEFSGCVDVLKAYQWDKARRGQIADAKHMELYADWSTWVASDWVDDREAELRSLANRWRDAHVQGDAEATACLIDSHEIRLHMPLSPRSFRDFYAFEQHVKTSRSHRGLDMVSEWYQFPVFYFSNTTSFRGPEEPVWAPRTCAELDFELEIACVIGKRGRNIPISDADAYIAGYCILNDWSARDIQRAEMKVGLGPAKGKDFATSLGPYLVTPDSLTRGAEWTENGLRYDLQMTAEVNGRQISGGNLRDIHYTFAEMIARASDEADLYPGDVIGSGTVGTGCILELGTTIQPWLQPGDVVTLRVDELGTLTTPVIESVTQR
jgi:fumarylacetoacetate (FAA) hydrolase